jgi:hypothetical protein
MGSSGTSAAQTNTSISIDVSKLDSITDLKSLISANSNAIFDFTKTLGQDAAKPVSSAVGASLLPELTLTATLPSWKAGPVTFSLTPTAKCTVTIAARAEDFKVATKVDDTSATIDVQPAPAGMTYVNIDLDFTLTGNASGSGTAYGVSISGKASGSAATTLSFCQPVPSDTLTLDALKLAFSQVVFPTGTGSLGRMAPGSSCRMNFDGSLNLGVTASYGLGPYMLSAASAGNVISSINKAVSTKITLPTATIKPLGTASVTYARTDHYGLVVDKSNDGNSALLYIIRSAKNEFGETAGISVGVTTTKVAVSLDPTAIQQKVQDVTGSATLATKVGALVTPEVNNLATSALSKLNTWIADVNGTVAASVALDQQDGRTALFNYSVDLTKPEADRSWDSLLTHSIADAENIPGFTLLAGSGFAEQIKRSTTLQFNLFNFYKCTVVKDFFDNSSSELAADGTIRLVYDIGVESLVSSNAAGDTMRFHFSATATEDVLGNSRDAEIDLNVEISEKNDPKGAAMLANLLGIVEAGLPAIKAMNDYVTGNPSGTLDLVAVVKQNAYAGLPFSPYTPGIDGRPPADQSLDRNNWNVIHRAAVTLMPTAASALTPVTYDGWGKFNSMCNTGNQNSLPDRRHSGNTGAVPPSFWADPDQAGFFSNFFIESARGMNLFEDLVTLAKDVANATTAAQWALIQSDVASIVKNDLDSDYSKPIAAAILCMAAQGTTTVTASTAQAKDASTFTTTLTLARQTAAGAGSGPTS